MYTIHLSWHGSVHKSNVAGGWQVGVLPWLCWPAAAFVAALALAAGIVAGVVTHPLTHCMLRAALPDAHIGCRSGNGSPIANGRKAGADLHLPLP